MATNGSKKLVIYTRYSSDLQRAESCADQERKVREALDRMGIDTADALVIKDEAISGTRDDRKGFAEVRRMVEAEEVAVLAVDEQSRFTRGDNVVSLIKDVVFQDGRFISVSESTDTDRDGWELTVGMMGIHHSASSRETGKRVYRGQEGRILDGNGSAGDFGYGYRSEYVDADWQEQLQRRRKPKKRVVIDDEQADVVRDVFRRFAEDGWAISRIVAYLNATRAVQGHRCHNGVWREDLVRRMLGNAKYIGQWVWGKTKTRHDGSGHKRQVAVTADKVVVTHRPDLRIIDDALWAKVQVRRAELADRYAPKPGQGRRGPKGHPRDLTPTNLVAGLIYCGGCGARLWTRGCGVTYLNCPNGRNGTCNVKTGVRVEQAQKVLLDLVSRVFTAWPDWLKQTVDEVGAELDRLHRATHGSVEADRKAMAALDTRIDRLVDALADGNMPHEVIRPRLRSLQDERRQLADRLAADDAVVQVSLPDEATVRRYVDDLPALLAGDVRDAAPLMRELFGKITAHEIIPAGKKRGYMQLRVPLSGRRILAAALRGRWPERARRELGVGDDNIVHTIDLGRPSKWDEQAPEIYRMRQAGATWREVTAKAGLPKGNAYRAMQRWKEAHGL